jgi:hypothetical protein
MSIWAFAVRRWQFTLVLFALLIALGVASFINIPRSEDPTFPFPSATITLVWPGANAGDMERLIVKPLEDAVNTLENVKKIVSSAVDGLAVVHVEFYYGSDPEKKQDEVIREFNRIRTSLPPDIAQIDIRKDSPGLVNIVQMALVSDTAGWRELKEKAENLKDLFGNLGFPSAGGARRHRFGALGACRRQPRSSHQHGPGAKSKYPRRRGGRGLAALQLADLRQLYLAGSDRRHRGGRRRRPHRQAQGYCGCVLADRRAGLYRPSQRQARGLCDRQSKGQHQYF